MTKNLREKLINVALILVVLFLFFQILPHFSPVLNVVFGALAPFMIAFILAYCLEPVVRFLMKKIKMKRNVAAIIVFALFLSLFIIFSITLLPLIVDQSKNAVDYVIQNQYKLQGYVTKFLIDYEIDIRKLIDQWKNTLLEGSWIFLKSSISKIVAIFSIVFMTPIFMIMIMTSYDGIMTEGKNILVNSKKDKYIRFFREIDDVLGKYIKGKVLDCFLVGVIVFILFKIIGLKYAFLFAMIIGVTNIIPYIGPVLGAIPACVFALIQGFPIFLGVLVCIVIIQSVESVFLVPYITSKTVNIHGITTLLVLLIGGSLFGILGTLLSIPVYLVAKVMIKFIKEEKELHNEIR